MDTYFIHIKRDNNTNNHSKDELKRIIIENIKDLNNENILDSDIKILDDNNSNKININLIGNIVINKNNIMCNLCNKKIKNNTKAKILDCDDVYHIKCINNYLNNSLYKDCPVCNIEYITHYIEHQNINFNINTNVNLNN
jgi:hypothetical protein